MRRRSRSRRVLKWMGLAASLLLLCGLSMEIWIIFKDYAACRVLKKAFPVSWWIREEMPICALFLLTAIPTALLWRSDRRIPPGHCVVCGYDLTGNVSGRCPECGTAVESEARNRGRAPDPPGL